MEKMAARVYCGVLLCLSGCLSTTEAAPGTNLTAFSVMASQSSDCVTAKPGECPLRIFEAVMCAELCVNDCDCPNNEKCCSNGCGHQCTAPYTANPGVCPLRKDAETMCPLLHFLSCFDDRDCPKNQKCCQNECGLAQCTAPTTAKPGVCPAERYDPQNCPSPPFVTCDNDDFCPKEQKCCNDGCWLQCMNPVTVKPAVCPLGGINPAMCPLIHFVPCVDDSNCASDQKCCYNGCGHQCMDTV